MILFLQNSSDFGIWEASWEGDLKEMPPGASWDLRNAICACKLQSNRSPSSEWVTHSNFTQCCITFNFFYYNYLLSGITDWIVTTTRRYEIMNSNAFLNPNTMSYNVGDGALWIFAPSVTREIYGYPSCSSNCSATMDHFIIDRDRNFHTGAS